MAKTNALRREIADFYQDEQEKFYESWERFKEFILNVRDIFYIIG